VEYKSDHAATRRVLYLHTEMKYIDRKNKQDKGTAFSQRQFLYAQVTKKENVFQRAILPNCHFLGVITKRQVYWILSLRGINSNVTFHKQ
jgi:hypothetical protein